MASRRPLIARGERAPDFALPVDGQEGATRYYGLVGGRPAVLVLAGEPRDGAVRDLLARLPALVATGLDVHVVVAGSSPGQGATSDLPAGTFHDPGGQVHEAYGVTLEDAPVVVVLDPNVRVLGAGPVSDVDAALAEVADTAPTPKDDHGQPAPKLAPVLFVADALDGDLREQLMARWETEGAVETGVETVVEGERAEATDVRRKRRRDIVITDRDLQRRLTQHIGARLFPELEKAFAFRAGGFEGFKVGCYTAEDRGYFEAHRDNLSAGTAHRRFGLTINLNDDYDGGELRFPEYGSARFRPAAGEALVFSGSHLHEVLPVERARRFVLLSFVLARSRGS
ncbi:MAG: 2OG-Fe(II) oxygenase [Nitriliruptoraceae bacterium]